MNESCESKVSNLLAGLSNLPNAEKWSRGFDILVECLGLEEKEIEELKKKATETPKILAIVDGAIPNEVKELEVHFSGEEFVWLRGISKDGRKWDTLPLKGEV